MEKISTLQKKYLSKLQTKEGKENMQSKTLWGL